MPLTYCFDLHEVRKFGYPYELYCLVCKNHDNTLLISAALQTFTAWSTDTRDCRLFLLGPTRSFVFTNIYYIENKILRVADRQLTGRSHMAGQRNFELFAETGQAGKGSNTLEHSVENIIHKEN